MSERVAQGIVLEAFARFGEDMNGWLIGPNGRPWPVAATLRQIIRDLEAKRTSTVLIPFAEAVKSGKRWKLYRP